MKTTNQDLIGKLIYSLIFMVVLPIGLLLWAKNASHAVLLPPISSPGWGLVLSSIGGMLVLTGMYALWHFGEGLPMNGYPPPKFVQDGAFKLLPHPIYTGFVLLCFGVSIYAGSAIGFWLISPIATLGCMALVWGYERIDLLQRFPSAPRQYWLAIPPNGAGKPFASHFASVYVCLLLPWVLLDASVLWINQGNVQTPLLVLSNLKFGPNVHWAMGIAAATWIFAAPLFVRTQEHLRQFFISGLLGGMAVIYLAFTLPLIGLGHATTIEGTFWLNAGLSLSWFWIWVATELYHKSFPALRTAITVVAGLLTLGLLLNSRDPLAHLLSGAVGFAFAFYAPSIWSFLRRSAEKVANSWQEWIFGSVRVINHGFYVGFGAFVGTVTGSILAGEEYAFGIVVVGVFLTVCAGLWGQFIEGSDKLKRPFGWYGSMVGVFLAILVIRWMGLNVWIMLGVFAVFMPWVQAIGRLRCLVNGCCHGAPSNEYLGIHYVHPRSRVCFISNLKGTALHPTQLYAMIWLTLVGGLQFRLWYSGASMSLLIGLYLMLNGLGRFVEEAYRGEPQTPIFAKLRLYQWAAIASLLIGMVLTVFEAPLPPAFTGIGWKTLSAGMINWLIVQFLMGIDFPKSNLRFSRLT